MRFAVRLLFHRGRILAWRDVINKPALVGDLRVEACNDTERKRCIRYAVLQAVDAVRPRDDEPTLYDPVLTGMSPAAFALTGFERIDGAMYAQSWHVSSQ